MTTPASLITTTIPFVNARPHVGFAYELVLADALARHRRRRGREVRFLTGTDENSLKNVVAAARENVPTRALVDRNAAAFRELLPLLDIAADDFIRTSVDPRHRRAVEHLWRTIAARGDLYRRRYTGYYCLGCEAFVDDFVVTCPEHGTTPELVSEENWFFRLSRYRTAIRDRIRSRELDILPDGARAETLAFLDRDVHDLSVSRDAARAAGWGIPVPDDPSQIIYVWFDALTNYIAALDYPDGALPADTTHVLGKGVTRFHAVYWPAFLLSAGLPLPRRIRVHGYLTVDGEKIRKSGGGGYEVPPVVAQTSADALRWYFLRRCRTRTDADVSLAAITAAHDEDLADRLGNLVQRTIALATRLTGSAVPSRDDESPLRALATALPARVDAALDGFLFDDATAAILALVDAANRELETTSPWLVARTDPARAAASLYAPLEAARVAAAELAPFIPSTSGAILARLGTTDASPTWGQLVPGAALVTGPPPVIRLARR